MPTATLPILPAEVNVPNLLVNPISNKGRWQLVASYIWDP